MSLIRPGYECKEPAAKGPWIHGVRHQKGFGVYTIAMGCKSVDSVRENDEPTSHSGAASIHAGLVWSNGDNVERVMVGRFPH